MLAYTVLITVSYFRVDIDRTMMPKMMLPKGEHTNRGPSPQLLRHLVLPPIGQTVAPAHTSSGSNNNLHKPKLPSIPQNKHAEAKPTDGPSALSCTR